MTQNNRTADHDIHAQFLERWSPRAFLPKPVAEGDLIRLFEAARWAPSASNLQPWRFLYAHHDSPGFADFLSLLVPFNQAWAAHAAVLILVASVRSLDGERPIPTHSFDTGAAWMSLALEAHHQGLAAHAMAGFDRAKATTVLGLPETWHPEVAVALGYRGDAASLPESLQQREVPSTRNPIAGMVFQGRYRAP